MTDILTKKPELVVEYTDPLEGFKGWLVIDAMSHKLCAGGMRVQKGLTEDIVVHLARNMTLKMRIGSIRADGAKSGIDYDPHSPGKTEALYRFVRSIRPFILERYSAGPDLNVKLNEIDLICGRLGIASAKIAIAKAQGFDLPYFLERYAMLENPVDHVTLGRIRSGSGLAAACVGVLDFLEIPLKEATVAVQGFGALGSAAAYCLHESGVRIIGLADEKKSVISKDGYSLDIEALIKDPRNGLIRKHLGKFEYGARGDIYDVKCDVFIPAAIENSVVANDAKTIAVKAIVPGANLAVTEEAEKVLYDRGIITIPDFVAGAGGSLSMDGLFGPKTHPSPSQVLDVVSERIRFIVRRILERSRKEHITPRQASLNLCSEARLYPDAKPYGPLEE